VKKHLLKDGDIVSLGVHELVYTDLRMNESANEEVAAEDEEDDDDVSVAGK